MAKLINSIVTAEELLKLSGNKNLVIIDARSGADAFLRYSKSHLKGARHADLDKELSSVNTDTSKGGRHPLPSLENFSRLLGTLGITQNSIVVVYDDKGGANAAARFWWMLQHAGHEKVAVLSGGLDAAVQSGFPVSSATDQVSPVEPYPIKDWSSDTVTINDVERLAGQKDYMVIDVREAARYQGKTEPIDKIAGHIPGAVNVPYSNNLDTLGNFKSSDELKQFYDEVIGDRDPSNVIIHCGSGVTACHTLLAMEQAGITGPKLFVGSWSQWSESGRPVARGE